MIKLSRTALVGLGVFLGVVLVSPPVAAAPRSPAHRLHSALVLPTCTQDFPGDWSEISLKNRNLRNEIFHVGTQYSIAIPGAVWHKWQNADGSYSAPVSLGGYTTGISGGTNDDGRLEVFAPAYGGDLAHIYQLAPDGQTGWSGWESLGGALYPGSGAVTTQFFDTAGHAYIMVKVVGVDYYTHCKAQLSPNGNWSDWY
jgi:hypothetical protein